MVFLGGQPTSLVCACVRVSVYCILSGIYYSGPSW